MKQNTIRAAAALLAAKMLADKGINFVPMPAKSEKHLEELKKQAADIIIDLAKEAGIDDTKIKAKFRDAGMLNDDDAPAQDTNTQDEDEPNFESLDGDLLYSLLSDMRDKLTESVKSSTRAIKEARGVAKLGFSNGVGMVIFLTSSRSVYDTAEQADFPGEENCGNPDCPGCNPTDTTNTMTIH